MIGKFRFINETRSTHHELSNRSYPDPNPGLYPTNNVLSIGNTTLSFSSFYSVSGFKF